MAIGNFGNIRAADIDVNNIDVFYSYSPDRTQNSNEFFRLTATDVLTDIPLPDGDDLVGNDTDDNLLEGMYNLTLPSTVFNETGIYTVYLQPKKYRTVIQDCGVLSALPSIKGILLDSNDLPTELTANNALQGFRVEYINDDGTKLRNVSRFITTSNKVIPVTENIGNTSQASVRYRFDDAGTLIFCQVTPSSSSNVKPNVTPFIGLPNQNIIISSTAFNPLAVEVEFVENDIDTVVDYVGGEQIKDVDNGILTHYTRDDNGDRQILKQFDLYEIKDDVGNVSLFEVKEERDTIDNTQDFLDITDSVQ
jgi:hypothetical protein